MNAGLKYQEYVSKLLTFEKILVFETGWNEMVAGMVKYAQFLAAYEFLLRQSIA